VPQESNRPDEDVTAQLLAYVDHTDDYVGVVNERAQVVFMNAAARKRLGYGLSDDLTAVDLFPPSMFARYYDEIRPAVLERRTWKGECELITQAGESVVMLGSVVGRVAPGGEVMGLVVHASELDVATRVDTTPTQIRDELTGLPMRALLDDRMQLALARAARDNQRVAIVHVDVDSLKDVNDTFGHATGDDVLRTLAHRMTHIVRDADTVARVGGDEFVVLLDGISDADAAIGLAHRLRETISRTSLETDHGPLTMRASFGVCVGSGGDRPEELLRRADAAMYRAKAMGGGNVVQFDEDAEVRVTTIADEFAVAVSHGRIQPHVQRVVNLRTRELHGYQGVARWNHESGELLDAGVFIDLVANTPMAPVVDLAVMRRTAAVAARRARRGEMVRTYGHLSRRLIGDVHVDRYLSEIADDLALAPENLCVEVSHALVARSSHAVRSALRSLHDAGVRTVLTDVHGACDVNEIVDHGFDELRLSRQLVLDATRDTVARRVVTATVALAHALDLTVLAVGIETEDEEMAMLDAGCDYGQGRLFGPIVPAGTAD
jgi:diguanylate cyclase (GGDEF)-like protein